MRVNLTRINSTARILNAISSLKAVFANWNVTGYTPTTGTICLSFSCIINYAD